MLDTISKSKSMKLTNGIELPAKEARKPRLIATQGVPGSGKSTWAAEQRGFLVVNRDDLRASYVGNHRFGSRPARKREDLIRKLRDSMIVTALAAGISVIAADTNLVPRTMAGLKALADEHGADFAIQTFLHIPLQVCVERDRLRSNSVGPDVILRMHRQAAEADGRLPLKQSGPLALIVDVDGTLANMGSRSPNAFDKVHMDMIVPHVARVVAAMSATHKVIVMSGRPETCRDATERWLAENGVAYELLLMRRADDSLADYVVKESLFRQYVLGNWTVDLVFDHRDSVVLMWRSLGLNCFQVSYGDF